MVVGTLCETTAGAQRGAGEGEEREEDQGGEEEGVLHRGRMRGRGWGSVYCTVRLRASSGEVGNLYQSEGWMPFDVEAGRVSGGV